MVRQPEYACRRSMALTSRPQWAGNHIRHEGRTARPAVGTGTCAALLRGFP